MICVNLVKQVNFKIHRFIYSVVNWIKVLFHAFLWTTWCLCIKCQDCPSPYGILGRNKIDFENTKNGKGCFYVENVECIPQINIQTSILTNSDLKPPRRPTQAMLQVLTPRLSPDFLEVQVPTKTTSRKIFVKPWRLMIQQTHETT